MYRNLFIFSLIFIQPAVMAEEYGIDTTGYETIQFKDEQILVDALEQIQSGDIDGAIETLKGIVEAYPTYRLGQLIYADILLSKRAPIREFGNYQSAPYDQISSLLDEARTRLHFQKSPPPVDKIPDSLAMMSENQDYAIIVDMSVSRLFIYQNNNGVPEYIDDFYTTIGKNGTRKMLEGDQRTPVGVYFVTSPIDPQKLPDLYGIGGFAIDYPNVWDKRHGRTGYGIWLHGTPSHTLNRAPRASDGCVVLSNGDLEAIAPYIKGDTPVLLAEKIEWVEKQQWLRKQEDYEFVIDQWKRDWESRNADKYLSHYSTTYSGLGMDYQAWVNYKKRVNPSKRYIKIGISEKSIFSYPGEPGVIVVTFKQRYESDNLVREFRKRQYWRKEQDGQWRIIYEGSVS
ncbi:MAG: L,D-transpeptidase family protein [Gammaproteobacteria bacterium]|nr:L,D-transpeptidase family protein [Gammaproteobacteria bacterium]